MITRTPTRLAIEAHIDESAGQINGQITALVSRFVLRDLLQEHDARVQALENALKPFAALLQDHNDQGPDSKPIFGINSALLTLGDLRRAALRTELAAVQSDHEIRHWAEEYECTIKCLDDAKVPKSDSEGGAYSLWGRIQAYCTPQPAIAQPVQPQDAKATLAERERCALVCESLHYTDTSTAQNCADAVRMPPTATPQGKI